MGFDDKFCEPLKNCGNKIVYFLTVLWNLLQDIFIIIRKNLRIRLRRFVALTLEMFTPIFVVCILAGANSYRALLRVETLEFTSVASELDANETLEGFYDLGSHFDEPEILRHNLCRGVLDNSLLTKCRIGYVADSETKKAVFDRLQNGEEVRDQQTVKLNEIYFKNATFIQFKDEKEIDDCLKADNECPAWKEELDARTAVLSFRGAIVFETSVNAQQVKYKIRLLEKQYGSLLHVFKTNRAIPSIYDRREYIKSYLRTGFLAIQLTIDRMIIEHMRTKSSVSDASDITFNMSANSDCPCELGLHEIPHRQTDQFDDDSDPLEINDEYYQDDQIDNDTDADFLNKEHFDYERFHQVHQQSLVVSIILVLSFAFILPSEQRRISSEKESGMTILLLITGMTHRMQWFGNLIALILSYIPTVTIMVILLQVEFDSRQGAVFELCSGSVLWLILFLHVAALASAGYCSTVFFDKPMTAISASVTFWISTFVGTAYHIDYYYDIAPVWVLCLLCLHPCIALQLAFRLLMRFEIHDVRTDIFTMSRTIPTDPMTVLVFVIILILDTVIYMMLTVYLDRILKAKYGVNKPWYYIFKASEYRSSTGKVAPAKMVADSGSHQPGFEPHHVKAEPSIITTNLTKKYGDVVALENLNIQLFHGEIFALLGHNGSGKSTTLNLFSGFVPATSGTAHICGYDITTHMVQIQAFTGMCPQHSSLYDDLTPFEHLLIFGRLRGLRGDDAVEESMELLEKLRIQEMAHWSVRKLSKGDKRKVSLAIALIGNPKVVILDEPTGGLDYYSRRAVWDLLLKIRSNHTIIFTTHFVDEAELLGDKIGILASGKMHVCGSHAFLRRHFKLGYSLRMKVDPHVRPDPKEILRIVRGAMPNATLSTLPISPNSNRLYTYNFSEDYTSSAMSTLFTDLAGAKEQLGILGFSVGNTTMDEIFLELTRQLNPDAAKVISIENDEEEYDREAHEENIKKMFAHKQKLLHFLVQYWTLVRKRMLFTWRGKKIFLFQIVVPLIVFLAGMVRLSSHIDIDGRAAPPLQINFDIYSDAITLYHATEESFIRPSTLKAVIGKSAKFTKNSDISGDYILTKYNTLRNHHIVGISAEAGAKGIMYVHVSPYVLHSAPIGVNIFSNALVKHLDQSRRIVTTNHPLQHPYFTGATFEEDPNVADFCSMLNVLSGAITVAFSVIFPVQERLNGMKHLQMMSGVHPGTYWSAIFTWDMVLVTFEAITILVFCYIVKPLRVILFLGDAAGVTRGRLIVFVAYIYCGVMMTYVISHFARSRSGSFALIVSIALLFGIILPFACTGLKYNDGATTDFQALLLWFFKLVPFYGIATAQKKFVLALLGNGRCIHFTELGLKKYCNAEPLHHGLTDTRNVVCCPNCPDIPNSENCFDLNAFTRLPWKHFEHHHTGTDVHLADEHALSGGFFYELVTLLIVGALLNFLTVFLDSDSWRYMLSCVAGERSKAFQTNVEDEDIVDEMDRVERMVDKKKTNKEALIVHNFSKSYGAFPALHNLSFTVHPGESFGIIGVNGAGKSTLFSVLTGDLTHTYGNAYSVDCSLNTKRGIFQQKMGYAPHEAIALVDFMTCMENVVLFGIIRGLSSKEAQDKAKELLEKMGLLQECGNKHVEQISGGLKRRLSLAVAIIGKPPIIVLDEPTSSSDPTARRHCWEILKEVKNAGHTLVFSSHTINECEDLCQRMAILVDGKFQCIGSPKHLREKFGSGYKLLVKLIPGPAESQGYVSSLSEAIVNIFNPCTLRDRRRNVIQYVIHNEDFSWDFLFEMMEHTKLRYNDLVEDYAFSNTTMEEVFLSFVVLQNCGRILDQSQGCFGCSSI